MLLRLIIGALLLTTPALAQTRPAAISAAPSAAAPAAGADLSGKWTYRSFVDTDALVGDDAQKALNLIFGEGVFSFAVTSAQLTGTLDMGGGYVLDLQGKVVPAGAGPLTVEISGFGRTNTPTAGWEYDYHAYLAYHWPNGVNQATALVGTVIRAKPHDGAPAGVVASFIAVKQP
jgi:hypothetical protein